MSYSPQTDQERTAFNAGVLAAKEVMGQCFAGSKKTKMLRFAIDKAARFGDANGYVHRWYKSTQNELDELIVKNPEPQPQ